MNKNVGIFGLLVFVCLFTAIINPRFVDPLNIQNTLRWTAEFGIISIGVALVIITGGIDLSLGSIVALVGCLLALCLEALSQRAPGTAVRWTVMGAGMAAWLVAAVELHAAAFRESRRRGWVALFAPPYLLFWTLGGSRNRQISGGSETLASGRHLPAGRQDCQNSGEFCYAQPPTRLTRRAERGRGRWLVAGYLGGAALAVTGWFLPDMALRPWGTVALVLLWLIALSGGLGLLHGLLITRLRLQPFVVTLCGLLFYRGIARWLTRDQTQGFGRMNEEVRSLAIGRPGTLAWLLLALGLAAVLWAGWQLGTVRRRRSSRKRQVSGGSEVTTTWPDGQNSGEFCDAQPESQTSSGMAPADPPIVAPWSVLGLGVVLLVAGGWHFAQDMTRLPRDVASGCQQMLFWSGLAGVIGTIAVVTQDAVRRRARSLLAAEGLAGAGLLVLWGAVELVRVNLAPATLSWLRVPAIMAALLLTMSGVSWCLHRVWRDGALRGRTLVVLALGGGVFLLAGLTPIDRVEVPAPLLILLAIAGLAVLFLDFTIYGRYLLALGRNEEAARYSGINTQSLMVTAYVLCGLLAGIAGILFALDVNSVQPSMHGNFYELYAIAAAVLGGCSLRGGEGSILGVIIGTAVIRVLYNAINFLGIPTQLEFAVLGAVILAGVAADELMKRWRKS